VATAFVLAASGMLGWGISASDGFEKSLGSALLLACAAAVCSAVILTGPVSCLIAVSTLQIVGFMPVLMRVGRVDFTLADVFYVGLVGWWSLQWALGRGHGETRREVRFGERAVLVFLAYVGVTTLAVLLLEPELFATSAISWIRLVQTALLAWLAASVIHTARDVRLLINALAVAATTSIGLAVGEALLSGESLSGRYGGLLGPNTLGLVSGLLIVLAVAGGAGGRMSHRVALGLIGALGLLVSKSQGALIGTALVVALALATTGGSPWPRASGTRSRVQRLNRGLLAAACACVAVVAAIQFLRPESIPTSNEFRKSTVYHRIIVGAGGLEIFSQHPVLGVGWRRSDSPSVIASSDLAAKLRRRFSSPNETFYPDVEITSVHNTYIQLLAELGLVGAALFGIAVWAVGRRVLALLRHLKRGSERWRQARFLTFGALLPLVWLNDNPLYGGQPETVLLAITLGSLVALARLRPAEEEELVVPAAEAPQAVGMRHPYTVRVLDDDTEPPVGASMRHAPRTERVLDGGLHASRTESHAEERRSRWLGVPELDAEFHEALRRLVSEVQLEIDSLRGKLREPSSATGAHEVAEPLGAAWAELPAEPPLDQEATMAKRGEKRRRGLFRRHKPGR
jgi:O-antigen ligase